LPRHAAPAWVGRDSEHDDDYTLETAAVATLEPAAGKQMVDAAEWIGRPQLSCDNGAFVA
jgi:hypothetical protein